MWKGLAKLHSDIKITINLKLHNQINPTLRQRVLNRWSKLSEQKLRFFSRMKIFKNAVNKK